MNQKAKLQIKYENVVKELNKHSKDIVILSTRYYKKDKLLARLIALGAILNERRKISHTSYLYKFGHDPRIAEATLKYNGVMHHGLHDKYFDGKFHGRVVAHIIPAKMSSSEILKLSHYIEHETGHLKYSPLKAIKSYFCKAQYDDPDRTYCTDFALDLSDKALGRKLVERNATHTPAKLYEKLEKEKYKKITIIDTKRF